MIGTNPTGKEGIVLDRRFILLALLIVILGASAGAEASSDWVRLHVVADSDGAAAQALKLEVRDAVLAASRALLTGVEDAETAWEVVSGQIHTLEIAAKARASMLGFGGPVACEVGVFPFPDRTYGGVTVPAGDYRALRVVIGAGRGRNWWCVLFPSLCDPSMLADDPPAFRSVVWDWLAGLFGGEAS